MSHWYTKDGSAMHYVPNEAARKRGEKGAMRETTIKDARKHNLGASVTTIGKVVAKGDILEEWTIRQALYAAAVHPDGWPRFRTANGVLAEDDPDFRAWADYCRADARRQVTVKAERGSILHDAMMKAHHHYDQIEPQYLAHVDGMMDMLHKNFGERAWMAECTFACHAEGFGGSIDLHTMPGDPDPIILDYKFKDFDDSKRAEYFVYDEHKMQLGGYRIGMAHGYTEAEMHRARCFNAFGSISHPGLVLLHAHSEADIQQGEAMFRAALALFIAKTGYRPKW